MTTRPAVHFVGFRGDEYQSARRVFGVPDFFHYNWDHRARRELADGDTVVFAKGDETRQPSKFSGSDIFEAGAFT